MSAFMTGGPLSARCGVKFHHFVRKFGKSLDAYGCEVGDSLVVLLDHTPGSTTNKGGLKSLGMGGDDIVIESIPDI